MLAAAFVAAGCAAQAHGQFQLEGGEIRAPLTAQPGDAERGRALAANRERGACVLCHAMPGEAFAGDIGPPLAGSGARLTPGMARARLVDSSLLNPYSVMPPYHRTTGLNRVAQAQSGKPVLTAQEVEDVIAWLMTLK